MELVFSLRLANLEPVITNQKYRSKLATMIAKKLPTSATRTPEIIAYNGHKTAAVLIPIQERQDGDYLVFNQRSDNLPTQKAKSLPGAGPCG
jgi:hypothetical protein